MNDLVHDRNGLEILDLDSCRRHLAASSFGRIGVTMGALPVVLPVNYRLVDDRIVFRTRAGTKLEAASRGSVVAFEIDGLDEERHGGWSVLVIGRADVVTDPTRIAELIDLGIPRWAPAADGHLVAIDCELISGREIDVP